ncbi:hypothetical protein POVWA2_022030 [Plasmodium ovale wallikeri]|uniref:Uncharacterized protein n=1 Tax=Plasmodium ovale wallikeri TaxID=864142 RepID=A0A1A8YT92_PLAOA|nr:hypothetical protein POVWA1_022210 [Plasmodium ovale wallikeri]SBT34865.1 hypothetical protein POVWA2_022030 [Plasmodium ovale wallikeri]
MPIFERLYFIIYILTFRRYVKSSVTVAARVICKGAHDVYCSGKKHLRNTVFGVPRCLNRDTNLLAPFRSSKQPQCW